MQPKLEMKEGLFSNDMVGNILARNYESARQAAGGKAIYKMLDKANGIIKPIKELEEQGVPHMPVPDFLNSKMMTSARTAYPSRSRESLTTQAAVFGR